MNWFIHQQECHTFPTLLMPLEPPPQLYSIDWFMSAQQYLHSKCANLFICSYLVAHRQQMYHPLSQSVVSCENFYVQALRKQSLVAMAYYLSRSARIWMKGVFQTNGGLPPKSYFLGLMVSIIEKVTTKKISCPFKATSMGKVLRISLHQNVPLCKVSWIYF